jgi:hypothetical protein
MLMWRARGYNLKDNFPDVFKGTAIRELEDDGQGFEHAKPARVVEPNFQKMTTREAVAFESSPTPEQFKQAKEAVKAAAQPETVITGPRFGEPKRESDVMRPSRSEQGPTRTAKAEPATTQTVPAPIAASSPVEEPPVAPPSTKPEAPTVPPKPPKEAPPDTAETTRYEKLVKKLAKEGINHDKFMLVMFDFGLLDPKIEREDISAGHVGLDKLDEKAIDLASRNWPQVLEEIAKL